MRPHRSRWRSPCTLSKEPYWPRTSPLAASGALRASTLQYDNRGAIGGLGRGTLTGQIVAAGSNGAADSPAGRFDVSLKPADDGLQAAHACKPKGCRSPPPSLAAPLRTWQRIERHTLRPGHRHLDSEPARPFPNDLTTSGMLTIDRLDATAPWLCTATACDCPRRTAVAARRRNQRDWRSKTCSCAATSAKSAVRGRLDPNLSTRRHGMILSSAARSTWPAWPRCCRMPCEFAATRRSPPARSSSPASCQPTDDGQLITGSVRTAQLAATSAGQAVALGPARQRELRLAPRRTARLQLDTLQVRFQVPEGRSRRHSAAIYRQRQFRSQQPGRAAWPIRRPQRHAAGRHRHAPSSPGSKRAAINSPPPRAAISRSCAVSLARRRCVGGAAAGDSRRSRRLARSASRIDRAASIRPSCKSTAKATSSTPGSPALSASRTTRRPGRSTIRAYRPHRPLAHPRAAVVRTRLLARSTGKAS